VANEDHAHVALPKLYGAPAYARPPAVPVEEAERPFDPDALPIEAVQTDEEREIARRIAARGYEHAAADSNPVAAGNGRSKLLRARPFRLRAITGLFRDNEGSTTD
jgi:hypothetical protein